MKPVNKLIIEYLKRFKKDWIAGGTLERNIQTISKPSTISRILRDMAESEQIYKDYKKVKNVRYVVYKYKLVK